MSFRLKTILGVAAIEAVLLALLVVSGLRWLHDSNAGQLVQRAATTSRLFASTTKDAVLATDLASLVSFVREAATDPGVVYARVRDADGRVLAEGGEAEALERLFAADTDPSHADDGVFDVFGEIREAGRYFGRVEVGLSVRDFQGLLREARAKGTGIALGGMFLVALFSFLLGTYLTRRLERLRDASRKIAEEGPGFSIPVSGRDEVAQAVVAFNNMSSRLAASYDALQHALTESQRLVRERERMDEELRLSAIAFDAQEAIFITDARARILRVNDAFSRVTGYGPEEAIGQTPRVLNSGRQDRDFYRRMWESLLRDGRWEGEIWNRRKNGEIYPQWLGITAMRDSEGRTSHYVAHFTDITERKRHEAELDEARRRAEVASEAKSRFLATMSHEIRTPLNAILNMNDVLLETDLDETQRAYARTASEAGRNLLSVVNSVLEFSKIEAGRVEQRPEACDPEEILTSVARLLAGRAYAKGIELTLVVEPAVPGRIRTDPGLLRQILLNLVGNAIKFTERGGVRLHLSVAVDTDERPAVMFQIIDTGIGVPQEKQAELFSEFVQVDGSYSRRYGGSGLGLAISRGLARLLGGDVGLGATSPAGSCFWLRVPALGLEPRDEVFRSELKALAGRGVAVASANPLLAKDLMAQLRAFGLAVQTDHRSAAEAEWSEGMEYQALLTLADGRPTHDTGQVPPKARQIRLARFGLGGGEGKAGPHGDLTLHTPVCPRELLRCLAEAARGAAAPQPAAEAAERVAETACAPERGRVLVVEDSPANQLVARTILARAGYCVDVAENGVQAVAAVKEGDYGLVLMDVAMPEMDGFDATRAIRALPGEQGRVPVVAMTANAFSDDRIRCIDAGMDDYLSKPIVRADLLAAAERWLRPSPARHSGPDAEGQSAGPALDEEALAQLEEDVSSELFPQMIATFMAETRRRLAEMESISIAGDSRALAEAAHAIKGAAGTFAAPGLQAAAAEVERLGKEGQLRLARERVPDLLEAGREALEALERRVAVDTAAPGRTGTAA